MNESPFLDQYLAYTRKQESPEMFHLWTGISILAAALGRKCWIDKGYYRLYPNLFTILVAGSARCRKSTALNLGIELLRQVETTKIVGGKITPEKFLEEIAPANKDDDPPNILVHSSELSVFLTKQNYGEPLIHILTDLFDCPDTWAYKTRNKGEIHLRNVFVSIIAATTPDGIALGVPPSALQEGFASRVLFVFQPDTDRRNALPRLSAEEKELKNHLADMLIARGKFSGEFRMVQDAEDWYVDWYSKMTPPADKRLEGMFGRKHDHLLRLAMVFAASSDRMIIDVDDMLAANMCVDFLETCAPGAFSELGGDDKTPMLSRARQMMQRRKRMTHSELLRLLYPCRADTFRVIVETLIESGEIMRDQERSNIYVYRGEAS